MSDPRFPRSIVGLVALLLTGVFSGVAIAQTVAPAPASPPQQSVPAKAPAAASSTEPASASQIPAITEQELRQTLLGKTFYLRDGYLDNTLHFNEDGKLDGSSPKASHTLSLIEITQVHLEKHKVELEGVRYGLHFLGASPSEDQTQAFDKVRLTTKKKPVHITIDREVVVALKKSKAEKEKEKAKKDSPATAASSTAAATAEAAPAAPEIAGTDRKGNRTTLSQAHANQTLRTALDRVFASTIDDRMLAALPDYWQRFYQAVEKKSDYRPVDRGILRQSQVDKKARLLSVFDPPSNEYAQNNGVAGIAMYHVVVGADGKPAEIAIGRPIGFGLDENAVDSIRKARFEPAMKDGKPVPVMLDLTVQFRIFSKLTAASTPSAAPEADTQSKKPELPGLYTLQALQKQAQQQQTQPTAQPADQPPAPSTQEQQAPAPATEQPPAPQAQPVSDQQQAPKPQQQ